MKIFNLAPIIVLMLAWCCSAQGQNHKTQGADYLGPDWYKITSRYTDNPILQITKNDRQEVSEESLLVDKVSEEKTYRYLSEIPGAAIVQNTSEATNGSVKYFPQPSWRGGSFDH